MNLRAKSVGLIVLVFAVILAGSWALFGVLRDDVTSGLGSMYVERQVMYKKQKTLHPVVRELALAQKLADSSVIQDWATKEDDEEFRQLALRELEDYRRFFTDRSFFCALTGSNHYYYSGADEPPGVDPLRYTLRPADPEDQWFFRTLSSGEPYKLNVDHDEKLGVTKVWMNVVLEDEGRRLGIVGTGIELGDFLAEVVRSDREGVTDVLIDETGAIQAHSDVGLIDFRSISKDPGERKTLARLLDTDADRAGLSTAMASLREGDGEAVESFVAHIGGREYLVGLGYMAEIGWFNVSMIDTGRIVDAELFLPFAALLLTALGVLSVAVVFLMNRLVFNRVSRLDRMVRDFSPELELPATSYDSEDEVGRLEQSFLSMAERVKERTSILEELVSARTSELARQNERLERALDEVRTLSGLLPTCMHCKKIRDEAGEWRQMEEYISGRSEATFSHGICPECLERIHGVDE